MRIMRLNVESRRPPGNDGGVVARFSAELTPQLTLHELRLCVTDRGDFRVRVPNVGGGHVADLHPELARELRELAVESYNEKIGRAYARGNRQQFAFA